MSSRMSKKSFTSIHSLRTLNFSFTRCQIPWEEEFELEQFLNDTMTSCPYDPAAKNLQKNLG